MIKRIRIKDFLSIESAELDLSEHKLCVVDGFNKDEGGKSNGSGKTAFLEAIRWAVLGDPGINRDTPIRHGAEAATVTLELEFRGHTFTLQRERKKRELFNFWIDEDCMTEGLTATDSQKKFEEHFDIDPEVFLTLFVVDGNTIQSFCNYTSSERISIVNKYFRNDRWEVYLDRASRIVDQLEREHQLVSAARDSELRSSLTVEDQDKIFKQIIGKKSLLEQEYYPFRKELSEYLKESAKHSSESQAHRQYLEVIRSLQAKIKDCEDDIKETTTKLNQTKTQIETLQSNQEELKRVSALIVQEEKKGKALLEEIKALQQEATRLHGENGKLVEYLRILEESSDSKRCEICGGKITSVSEKIKQKKSEIDKIGIKSSKVRSNIDQLELQLNRSNDHLSGLKKKGEALTAQIRFGEEQKALGSELTRKLHDLKNKLVKVQGELAYKLKNPVKGPTWSGIPKPPVFRGRTYEMDELNREIEVLVSDIRSLEDQVKRSEQAKERIKQLDTDLGTISTKLEVYRFWEKAFGKYGIPIRVLDNFLPMVQERTNQYLGELNSVFRVALETKVPRKKEDGFKEKMEILIKNTVTGSNFTLRSNSRGEVKAIATVLFLAFNSIVRDREGFDFNVLLLDEVFDGLDRVSRGMVFNLISRLTGFQILATSHYQDVNDKFHSKLLCTKERGATVVTEAK